MYLPARPLSSTMQLPISWVAFALGLALPAMSATVSLELTTNNAIIAPDGYNRSAVLMNGQFPGPLIKGNKGDILKLNVTNNLTDPTMRRSTSIHWHGLFQHRTAEADGPAFVTQCPIAPNNSFLYNIPLNEQTGTFWYHSHLSTQYCDGLRGPLVIYDPDDPLKYMYDVDDESTVITLADWYHTVAPKATEQFLSSHTVPIPDSGTINGKGRFLNGPEVAFAVVNVVQGKRYRLRVINIGCRPFHTFSIDGHKLVIIEADGIEHEPLEVDQLDIYAGQRYSIVLTANQPVDNYWIRAPLTGGTPAKDANGNPNPRGNPNLDPSLIKAILRYAGAPDADPTTNQTSGKALDEADLHPLINPGAPGGYGPPDFAMNLNITMPNPPFFEINNVTFESPKMPALLQILNGATNPMDFLPSENIIILPPNSTIEISIPFGGAHPFHLHGHTFDIIRTSGSNVTNYKNPPRRDVVAINGGNTTFRFFTDNPGPWFLHCHIDWHLEVGLAVIMAEAPADQREGPNSQIISPAWHELCPIYDALPPELQ